MFCHLTTSVSKISYLYIYDSELDNKDTTNSDISTFRLVPGY